MEEATSYLGFPFLVSLMHHVPWREPVASLTDAKVPWGGALPWEDMRGQQLHESSVQSLLFRQSRPQLLLPP